MPSDAELLQAFAETRSEPAFTALVQRHLPLVYAVAWRQLDDAHRAQDVAQTVFALLARKATTLRGHPSIAGWLHTATHHTAAKVRRTEQRRLRREQEALAMSSDLEPAAEAEQLRPVIDAALADIKDADRAAVLLRYFDQQSYAAIGTQLGLSENTVRMRVDRALDRLRKTLAKRGIDSTAAAIGLALAAPASAAVPAGLASSISSAALATSASGGLLLFMSATVVKNIAIAALIVAGAAGLIFQHQKIEALQADNVRLAQAARSTVVASMKKPAVDQRESARLPAQVAPLRTSPANSWQDRVSLLKEVLEQLPEQNIPEIALASEDDWLEAAKPKLETSDDYRKALAKLHSLGTAKFTQQLQPALAQYLKAHNDQFPTSVSELQALMDRKIDDAIWRRYIVAPSATVGNVRMGGDWIITQASIVDPTFDHEFVVGPRGHGSTSYGAATMPELYKAYKRANGKPPDDAAQLLPYATTPRERAVVAALIDLQRIEEAEKKK